MKKMMRKTRKGMKRRRQRILSLEDAVGEED